MATAALWQYVLRLPVLAVLVLLVAACVAGQQEADVFTFGTGPAGELGLGGKSSVSTPGFVETVSFAASGLRHTLLVKEGKVYAFGDGTHGQVGAGTGTSASEPREVSGVSAASSVSASTESSWAKTNTGEWYGWGRNDNNQLGLKEASPSNKGAPVLVPDMPAGTVKVVGGSSFTIAVTGSSAVSWGSGAIGRAGGAEATPMAGGFSDIACGPFHCVGVSGGSLLAWGDGDLTGTGDTTVGMTVAEPEPVLFTGGSPSGFTVASVSDKHAIACDSSGKVWTWGDNSAGALGYAGAGSTSAKQVSGVSGCVGVAAGGEHSLVITDDGNLWSWGATNGGALGYSGSGITASPKQATFFDTETTQGVAAGATFSVALVKPLSGFDRFLSLVANAPWYVWAVILALLGSAGFLIFRARNMRADGSAPGDGLARKVLSSVGVSKKRANSTSSAHRRSTRSKKSGHHRSGSRSSVGSSGIEFRTVGASKPSAGTEHGGVLFKTVGEDDAAQEKRCSSGGGGSGAQHGGVLFKTVGDGSGSSGGKRRSSGAGSSGAQHGGVLFKTVGDAADEPVAAVFESGLSDDGSASAGHRRSRSKAKGSKGSRGSSGRSAGSRSGGSRSGGKRKHRRHSRR